MHVWSRPQDTWNSDGAHLFIGGTCELRIEEVPHVTVIVGPISALFVEVIQLFMAETSKYYSQYLDILDSDVRHDCTGDIHLLAIRQMGHMLGTQ